MRFFFYYPKAHDKNWYYNESIIETILYFYPIHVYTRYSSTYRKYVRKKDFYNKEFNILVFIN